MRRSLIKRSHRLLQIAAVAFIFLQIPGKKACASTVKVYDRASLKEELSSSETETIELMETVTVRGTLTVRGNKTLKGPGSIKRAIANNSAFGGTLLSVKSGTLKLKNITISGRGDADVLHGKLYGWLIEVAGGHLVIDSGATLCSNVNLTRTSDGGGAVRIKSGAGCTMKGGQITGNACITGGAGVRIDSGGVFSMQGGSISGNTVAGKSSVAGFEGLGGGIYNRGTVGLYGGSITGNKVSGHRGGVRHYGGVGGGVANVGQMVVSGTYVRSNTGNRGLDIGVISGTLTLKGSVSIGDVWLKSGKSIRVSEGFNSGSKIRISPENKRAGVKLVGGSVSSKTKDRFKVSELNENGLMLKVDDGYLRIVKKPVPTPTKKPTSTYHPSSGGGGGYHRSDPVRIYPTYKPVATINPYEEIVLFTPAPSAVPTLTPVPPVSTLSLSRLFPTRTPYARPVETVVTNTIKQTQTPVRATPTPAPNKSEVGTWVFSKEEILRLKKDLKVAGIKTDTSAVEFLTLIRGCRA